MTTKAEYLPQSEGADWFLVIDPKEGIVHHAYTAELGRSLGHDHIKDAQLQGDVTAKRWVVRPAFAAVDPVDGLDAETVKATIEGMSRYTYGYKSDEWGMGTSLRSYEAPNGPFLLRDEVLKIFAAQKAEKGCV